MHFCQGLPIVLVGCKKDLRYDQGVVAELHKTSQGPVTPEEVSSRWTLSRGPAGTDEQRQGEMVRQKIGALKYVECSAKTNEGVREVFEIATKLSLSRKKKKLSRFFGLR